MRLCKRDTRARLTLCSTTYRVQIESIILQLKASHAEWRGFHAEIPPRKFSFAFQKRTAARAALIIPLDESLVKLHRTVDRKKNLIIILNIWDKIKSRYRSPRAKAQTQSDTNNE